MRHLHFTVREIVPGASECAVETGQIQVLDLAKVADLCLNLLSTDMRVSEDLRTRAGNARLALDLKRKAGPVKASIAEMVTVPLKGEFAL